MPLFPHLQLRQRFQFGWAGGLGPQNRPVRVPCMLHTSLCAVLSAWAFLSLVGPHAFLLHLPIWLRTIFTPILIGEPYSPSLLPPHSLASASILFSSSNHPPTTPLLRTSSPWAPLFLFLLLYLMLLTAAHRAHSLSHADSSHLFPMQHARITREEALANLRERYLKLFRICSYLFFVATLCLVQQQWRAATKAATRATHAFAHRYTDPWRYERPLVKTMERDSRGMEEGIRSELWYAQWGQELGEILERGNKPRVNEAAEKVASQPPMLAPEHLPHRPQQWQDGEDGGEVARKKRITDDYVATWLSRAFCENNYPLKHYLAFKSHPRAFNSSSSWTVDADDPELSPPQINSATLASVWRSHFLSQWDRVWLALWLGDVLMIGALARLLGWSPRMLVRELWWTTKAIVRDWTRGGRIVVRAAGRAGRRVGRRVRQAIVLGRETRE